MDKEATKTLEHVYADTQMRTHAPDLRTQAKVPKTMKGMFFLLKLRFEMNPTSSRSHPKPQFSQYKRPYIIPFQNT